MLTEFRTDAAPLQARYDDALSGLRANLHALPGYGGGPVLFEGAEYKGIWLECGPHEGAVYGALVDPRVGLDCHRAFFHAQREDGYLPCYLQTHKNGTAHVQTVVPVAKSALEVYGQTEDRAFLEEAYAACSRYDDWLSAHRDTRGAGLCELFCEWDTGHDHSPRVSGLPHECPNDDARVCPDVPGKALPWLAPDLSATVYGSRVALAAMARTLGRDAEAGSWNDKAEATRRALLSWCFDPEACCFFDLDADGRFVRIRGAAMLNVLQEHVPDASLFDALYRRHVQNPEAFWTPYPFPSVAADDPAFARDLPHNSWGGPTQALTALRAPRWMEHYGRHADLAHLMARWVEALARADGFRQQLHPWTGEMIPAAPGFPGDGYSPSMLVLLDFVARLYGVRAAGGGAAGALEWNCRLPDGATESLYRRETPRGTAELTVTAAAGGGQVAVLRLGGRHVAEVAGGPCRLVTDAAGIPIDLIGTEPGLARAVRAETSAGKVFAALAPDEWQPLGE